MVFVEYLKRYSTKSKFPEVGLKLLLTVKFRQPSDEFTFGVGMSFISYPLVLTPFITSSFVHVSFGV
jgi:hypothetical protein